MAHERPPRYRFCPCCGHPLELRQLKIGEPERLCCDGCDYVFYLDPKLAAGVVVEQSGQVLLVRRAIEPAYGAWVFPGGFVDRGEHPEEAAVREAREEAGVDVRLTSQVGIYSYPPGSPVILIVYRGQLVGGEAQALDECLEVDFFAPDRLPWPELAFETTRLALGDYARSLGCEVPAAEMPRLERPRHRL